MRLSSSLERRVSEEKPVPCPRASPLSMISSRRSSKPYLANRLHVDSLLSSGFLG